MMATLIGISNLMIGTAYVVLGLLSAWEAIRQRKSRGLSRFGLGFSLMAASCGPHHLVHGWCVLQGGAVSAPMMAVAVLGLPAGLIFCWLRAEAMWGGRGDRTVMLTSPVLGAAAVVLLVGVGSLAGWAMAVPPDPALILCTALGLRSVTPTADTGFSVTSPILLTNLWVSVAYSIVGWYLIKTQIRRYVVNHAWSLSGLSLSSVFPTCAAMHLIVAFTSSAHSATLPFDLLGVPASVYFLWVVKQLHSDSMIDWNRRPLAGVSATPIRASPWDKRI